MTALELPSEGGSSDSGSSGPSPAADMDEEQLVAAHVASLSAELLAHSVLQACGNFGSSPPTAELRQLLLTTAAPLAAFLHLPPITVHPFDALPRVPVISTQLHLLFCLCSMLLTTNGAPGRPIPPRWACGNGATPGRRKMQSPRRAHSRLWRLPATQHAL